MKDISDEIMLCFVQAARDRDNRDIYNKNIDTENENTKGKSKTNIKRAAVVNDLSEVIDSEIELRERPLSKGRSLRLSSGEKILKKIPDVKRSFSDRFSVISDTSGKKSGKGLLTIRKTWSTGNFSPGAGGGGGAPRSAPATPLQLEPQARATKHDKHAVKPLSGSAPSVRVGIAGSDDTTECKQPSKSRQKKFQRHFPQVGPEERVLNYYSCALVGDILLQGHLYITKNYFAFYSNVFGYVTKLLIPTSSVLRITKEKVARIIPNAVGVCTRDERHVFGSLLSRDATYKLMTLVWKSSKAPELAVPKSQDLRTPEISEYSPEDDSSSGGADHVDSTQPTRPEPEAIMAAASAAVIQPALLTGTTVLKRDTSYWHLALLALAALLTCSAMFLSYRLYCVTYRPHEWATSVSSEELYSELVRWRTRLHGRAANELHAFLSTNLMLLTKVRQSLEALSGVILTDMAEQGHRYADVPNDTLFS
ncbi:membrane-anchored lipid-binding protein YSP2-like isoform X2 [Pieris brassicae]|uniref:membrane-anchored lipid-binding protein YSP2-like isoform X2 n=1 Tax=Pieris brassicae TaxID=7116 RepID=UPI001E65E713|nr:membrane-anchored lipid-binding protein YSP2-like isoform X2 [Pieris brassicae]